MPLIRYRTGDISRWLTGGCPRGTPLKTLERVNRRVSGHVAAGDQWQLTIAALDEAIFCIAGVLDFSAAISREGAQDCLLLEVRGVEAENDNIAGAIDAAMESIPAIGLARASGRLELVVSVRNTRAVVARPIKRTIADRRTIA